MFVKSDLNRIIFAVELLLKNASVDNQNSLVVDLSQSKIKVPQRYKLVDETSNKFIANIQNYGNERFSPQSKNNDFLTVDFNKAKFFKNDIKKKLLSLGCKVRELNNHVLEISW